ncbi:MAG: hypothetical protein M9927_10585 [Anaerolineae bacterium]|nr:hypothetical protein [Anaerolineae bacterium]
MLDDSAFAGSMRTASRFMGDIERLGSETLADVHESERIYVETVRKTTERARRLADLWTAQHFGLSMRPTSGRRWPTRVLHGSGMSCPAGRRSSRRASRSRPSGASCTGNWNSLRSFSTSTAGCKATRRVRR